MLSPEQNAQLTQVGAGTPMGELLRRYWMPIAGGCHTLTACCGRTCVTWSSFRTSRALSI